MLEPLARPAVRQTGLSPYAAHGFWRNPFGELSVEERTALAVVDSAPLLDYLTSQSAADRYPALQFIGDCGFGKTTHLLVLESLLPGSRRVYFPEHGRRPRLPVDSRVLIVDEAQRMGWRRRRQMLRHRGPLVLSTHEDLSNHLQRNGFALWTIDVGQPKPSSVVAEVLNRRIAASLTNDSLLPNYTVDEQLAQHLNNRFTGNLRTIEAFLFESFQAFIKEKSAWPPVV